MMKIVYICERPYNLYRTLLKAVNSDDEMDLVISDNTEGMGLMCDDLRKSGLFNNVFFFNELKHKRFSHPLRNVDTFSVKKTSDIKTNIVSLFQIIKSFFDYLKSQRKAKHIRLPEGLDFNKYNEIHMTDCTSILNFYLYHKKFNNLVYVEHAKDALKDTYGEKYPKITDFLSIFVKLRVIYGIRGSCRYIKTIEVNENKDLIKDTEGKEIREIPLDKLVSALSPEQEEFIYQIYAKSYNLNYPCDAIIDIYLTTSHVRGIESNMYFHMCKEIIKDFMSDADFIIIKPHPSDWIDYSEIPVLYKNAVVLPACFSVEIFALSSTLKIRKLINISTSAVEVFKSVEKIINIDDKFIEKCRGTM